ncbi:unnamed protein product [Meganyctiphanes norvegica]|uniref:Ig-like domain-containing protein n=1 Tax=Meganyctiphanes norvegica TaxID=48144 RepID=A0AAV2R7J8_MEGNR
MHLPRHPYFMVTFMILANTVCHGIIILEEDLETPPEVLKTGSLETLTLDCPFVMEEKDIPEHLTVQWMYNGYDVNIYQWIPITDTKPQSLGPFKDRVNLEYEISSDPMYKHRALSLLNPTTELTGIYTCRVSSFEDDDKYLNRRVIIYSEPSEFKIQTEQINQTNVKITCEADNIFPEPEVYIYKNYNGELVQLEDTAEEKTWKSSNGNEGEGTYTIHAEVTIADEDLTGLTQFGCDLRIPETNVSFTDTLSYEPRITIVSYEDYEPESAPRNDLSGVSPHEAASTRSGSSCRCHFVVLLLFVSVLLATLSL